MTTASFIQQIQTNREISPKILYDFYRTIMSNFISSYSHGETIAQFAIFATHYTLASQY